MGTVVHVRARPAAEAHLGEGRSRSCTRCCTVTAIVLTANHYFLDAVGGFIVLGVGYVLARIFTRAGRREAPTAHAGHGATIRTVGRASSRLSEGTSMRLDHVALATRDVTEPLAILVGRLGGTVISGGEWIGFRPMQVFLGNDAGGMKVELLEPWDVDRNDFLERFLQRHGAGPHHLTFKVDDLPTALDRVSAAGFTPVSVDLTPTRVARGVPPPTRRPRDGRAARRLEHGDGSPARRVPRGDHERGDGLAEVVARAAGAGEGPSAPPVHRAAVPDGAAARGFFGELLGGSPTESNADDAFELEWPGGGRLRFEVAPDAAPGIDRLELEGEPAELEIAGARFVVVPERALARRRRAGGARGGGRRASRRRTRSRR